MNRSTRRIATPDQEPKRKVFTDADAAVAHLQALYSEAVRYLCDRFTDTLRDGAPDDTRYRAFYP